MIERNPEYCVICYDPRNGYCSFDFWDTYHAREGIAEFVNKVEGAAAVLFVKSSGKPLRYGGTGAKRLLKGLIPSPRF